MAVRNENSHIFIKGALAMRWPRHFFRIHMYRLASFYGTLVEIQIATGEYDRYLPVTVKYRVSDEDQVLRGPIAFKPTDEAIATIMLLLGE